MRGTWDDVNRRLVGALLALDLHDALVLRAHPEARRGLFRKAPEPRRFAQVTAAQTVLIAEVWPATDEQRHGGLDVVPGVGVLAGGPGQRAVRLLLRGDDLDAGRDLRAVEHAGEGGQVSRHGRLRRPPACAGRGPGSCR